MKSEFALHILGGTEIEMDEAPYNVNYGDVCGGVLIHKKWAITTAHCGKIDFIRVGHKRRLNGPRVKVSCHIMHPKFGKKHEYDYDIQLLHLKRSLRVTDDVQPIALSNSRCGDFIYVVGWGFPQERGDFLTTLQQVKLQVIPFKSCQKVKLQWYNHTLTNRMFCAGGDKHHDACQGDSGGAAVSMGRLVGISSFGYGCGRDIPGVYINVSEPSIRNWIRSHTDV